MFIQNFGLFFFILLKNEGPAVLGRSLSVCEQSGASSPRGCDFVNQRVERVCDASILAERAGRPGRLSMGGHGGSHPEIGVCRENQGRQRSGVFQGMAEALPKLDVLSGFHCGFFESPPVLADCPCLSIP